MKERLRSQCLAACIRERPPVLKGRATPHRPRGRTSTLQQGGPHHGDPLLSSSLLSWMVSSIDLTSIHKSISPQEQYHNERISALSRVEFKETRNIKHFFKTLISFQALIRELCCTLKV